MLPTENLIPADVARDEYRAAVPPVVISGKGEIETSIPPPIPGRQHTGRPGVSRKDHTTSRVHLDGPSGDNSPHVFERRSDMETDMLQVVIVDVYREMRRGPPRYLMLFVIPDDDLVRFNSWLAGRSPVE